MNPITFSNPRFEATIADWPLGSGKRGPCTFKAEFHPGRGVRILRTTTGKPKATTYCQRLAIVDGSDGRLYILQASPYSATIGIWTGTLMNADQAEIGRQPYVSANSEPEAYAELAALIAAPYNEQTAVA